MSIRITKKELASAIRKRTPPSESRALSKREKAQVKKMLKARKETKYLASVGFAVPTYAGTLVPMTKVPIGTGVTERIGDQLVCDNMYFRYNVIATASTILRVIIFRWHPNSSVQPPSMASLLANSGTAYAVNSEYNQLEHKNYTILSDVVHMPNAYDLTGLGSIVGGRKRFKVRHKIDYTTDPGEGFNNVYMALVGHLIGPTCTVYYNNRFDFKDA